MFPANSFSLDSSGKDEIAEILKVSPGALKVFEQEYEKAMLSREEDDPFGVSAKQAAKWVKEDSTSAEEFEKVLQKIVPRIVEELFASVSNYKKLIGNAVGPCSNLVTKEEIAKIPVNMRPQLTGRLYRKDLSGEPSYVVLLDMYRMYTQGKSEKERRDAYHRFRQGLDILDLDPILYKMLGTNPNSMGFWFPKLKKAVDGQDFFKVPKTKIVKVPLPILQLTRLEYTSLTPTTLKIVDDFCMKAFDLDVSKTYFIKTGTYSSKFDFRNAKVTGEKEIRELGEYLLFIQNQAVQMAGPLSQPSIYGVSTTNEWVVREYIEDVENNPCIYKGLPLHTEFRAFVDFDTDEILSIVPYWDSGTMKKRFGKSSDSDTIHNKHDYVIYTMHEPVLMDRYYKNVDAVKEHLVMLVPDVELSGQWSIDIMMNGNDFYIIDMGLAENSAFYNSVPIEKRRVTQENWLPDLSEKTKQ